MARFARLFFSVILYFVATLPAFATSLYGELDSLSRQELLMRSWNTPSSNERTRIRHYIAQKWPNSAEGLMCKGHLLGLEGKRSKAQPYFEKALRKDPSNPIFLIKASSYYYDKKNYKTVLKLYGEAENNDAAFDHYYTIRESFNLFANELKDTEKAFKLLEKKRELYGDKAAFDYSLAQYYYYTRNDYAKAFELYSNAIEKPDGADFFDLWKAYYFAKIKLLSRNGNITLQKKFVVLKKLASQAQYLSSNSNINAATAKMFSYQVYDLIGDELKKAQMYDNAIEMYMAAFMKYPATEMLLKLNKRRLIASNVALVDQFIEEKAKYFGKDTVAYRVLAQQSGYHNHFDKAKEYLHKAIKTAVLEKEKYTATDALNMLYSQVKLNNRDVESFYKPLLNGQKRKDTLYDLTYYALISQDLNRAKKYLKQYAALKRHNKNNLKILKGIYKYLLELEVESNSFYGSGSFGKYWSEHYADGLRVNVNFKTGSATINPSDIKKLDKVGEILSQKDAAKYAFVIEGHTDSSGNESVNLPLSQKRAISVVRFLHNEFHIPFARLKPVGKGSKYPVATNKTAKGKAANRRVEISLVGSMDKPEIKATTNLVVDWAEISPDDRYIASGYAPMKLWDVKNKTTLKRFSGYHRIRKFSPNGKYLAAIKTTTRAYKSISTIVFYNTLTMKPEKYFTLPGKVQDIAWSPYSDALALYSGGYLYKISIRAKKILSKYIENVIGSLGNLVWVKEKNYIAFNFKNPNGAIRIYSGENLEHVKDITGRWFHGIGAINSGRYLIATTNSRHLYRIDLDTWELNSVKIRTLTSKIEPIGKNMVVLNDFGSKDKEIILFDVNTMKVVASNGFGNAQPYFTVGKNKLFTYNWDEKGKLFQLQTKGKELLSVIDTITGKTYESNGIYADEKNRYVVTTDPEGVHVWNLKSGRKIHIWKDETSKFYQSQSHPSHFYAVYSDNEAHASYLYLLDTSNLTKTLIASLGNIVVTHMSEVGGRLIVAGNEFKINEEVSKYGTVLVFDKQTKEIEKKILVPLVTKALSYATLYDARFDKIALSPDLTRLIYTNSWIDGWKKERTSSDYARVFDIETEDEVCKIDRTKKHSKIAYLSDDTITNGIDIFNSKDCTKIKRYKKEKTTGEVLKNTDYTLADFKSLGIKVRYTSDNTLKFFDKKGDLRLTVINKKNNEWIAYTPSGYYASSLNGDKGVVWYLAGKMIPFESVKKSMKRPHIVQESMEALLEGKQNKTLKKAVDIKTFNAPYKITLLSKPKLKTKKSTYELVLDVEIIDPKAPTPKMSYAQNGRWLSERGLHPKRKNNVIRIKKTFTLQEGENKIVAAIDYRGNRFSPVEVSIVYDNKKAESKQTLWFLGVGVSKYAKSSQNLEYADKDAISLGKALKAQEGKLFAKVKTKVLTNSDATVTNIKRAVHKFLMQAKKEDIVVLFIAGHGLEDEQNLYYIAYDSDGDEPYTGLEVSYFENYLRKRPTGQKAVFWMDICHAGAYGTSKPKVGLTAEEAVSMLADETDTIVFASSSGREESLESEYYGNGHGAFTYALLSGLNGDADLKMGDRDGFVNLLELTFFVTKQVPKLTESQQHPTIPSISHLRDYPLARY